MRSDSFSIFVACLSFFDFFQILTVRALIFGLESLLVTSIGLRYRLSELLSMISFFKRLVSSELLEGLELLRTVCKLLLILFEALDFAGSVFKEVLFVVFLFGQRSGREKWSDLCH